MKRLPNALSSHCSDVSPLLELGRFPDEAGRSRFCGVTGLPADDVILILGASPLLCFKPNCEKGFCGESALLEEPEILIVGFEGSFSDGAGGIELGACDRAGPSVLPPSSLEIGCVGA